MERGEGRTDAAPRLDQGRRGDLPSFPQFLDWAISDRLNGGLLPSDFYALAEQQAADESVAPPEVKLTAETDLEYYRRKQDSIAVRHVSGDRIVAMVEIVSPANKGGRHAFRAFVDKAAKLLDNRVHLLLVDLFPPGPRDPRGIHGAIWEEQTGQEGAAIGDECRTLAAYASGPTVKAYVETLSVVDSLADMPLFLEPDAYVNVPLDATYQSAFGAVPSRWQRVLTNG